MASRIFWDNDHVHALKKKVCRGALAPSCREKLVLELRRFAGYSFPMARSSILIVDSDSELAQIIGSFLNFHGFRVNHSTKVRDAISKISLQKYSAILIDPDLQGIDGDEVIRAASDPNSMNNKTPIIVMSGSLDYELATDVVNQVQRALPKPFTFEDLVKALSSCSVIGSLRTT